MLTRNTVVAALAGLFVSLLILGSFLALDRTTLHWYAEEGASASLTAAEAEAFVISHIIHADEDASLYTVDNWFPDCAAQGHSQDGWLVRCGMKHPTIEAAFPQIVTYLVADDGAVAAFP